MAIAGCNVGDSDARILGVDPTASLRVGTPEARKALERVVGSDLENGCC